MPQYGYQSGWANASDAFMQTLAQADINRRKLERETYDRAQDAMRMKISQDASASNLETAKSNREQNALENARIQAQTADLSVKSALAAEKEARRRALIQAYQAAPENSKEARAAQSELLVEHGITPQQIREAVYGPPQPKPELTNIPEGGKIGVLQPDGSMKIVATGNPKAVAEKAPGPAQLLPAGTKSWLNSLASMPPDEALQATIDGWPQQQDAHPNADLARGIAYVKSLYGVNKITGKLQPLGRVKAAGAPTAETPAVAGAPSAPSAPAGWKYVPKAGGGWTAIEDK